MAQDVLTRLDWDTNPAYPWHGIVSQAALLDIIPAGPQEWIVVHRIQDQSSFIWVAWRRVFGDWHSGAPHSNLTLGDPHYFNFGFLGASAGFTPSIQYFGIFDAYPASQAGTKVGTIVVAGNAFPLDFSAVATGTIDFDSGLVALTNINQMGTSLDPYTSPPGFGQATISCTVVNPLNISIISIVFGDFIVGSINPQTGAVSTPVYVPAEVNFSNFSNLSQWSLSEDYGYIAGFYPTFNVPPYYNPQVLDFTSFPVNVVDQTTIPAFVSDPNRGNLSLNRIALDGSMGTLWNSAYLKLQGVDLVGDQLLEGANYLTFPYPENIVCQGGNRQRFNGPASAATNLTPFLTSDSFTNPTKLTLSTIGHTTDGSPTIVQSFDYPEVPIFIPGTSGQSNVWYFGGLAMAQPQPSTPGAWLHCFQGAYDINGGTETGGGHSPNYGPPLWVFDSFTNDAFLRNPFTLWAGAIG